MVNKPSSIDWGLIMRRTFEFTQYENDRNRLLDFHWMCFAFIYTRSVINTYIIQWMTNDTTYTQVDNNVEVYRLYQT